MRPAACARKGSVNASQTIRLIHRKCGERFSNASTDNQVRRRAKGSDMRTFLDSKAMARALRNQLAEKKIALTHSECLELVAEQFGFDSWNVLAAMIGSDDSVRFGAAIPILRIFDADKAREFYIDFLGFKFDWISAAEWKPGDRPLYTQISRGSLIVHLSEHHGDASPGANAYVTVTDIEALHGELAAKGYTYGKPNIEEVLWGRSLQVHDPFGNRLRFTELNQA
jgi:catechol 2,3-dioxygenase-like lactoylglutathione lyase family enzyme